MYLERLLQLKKRSKQSLDSILTLQHLLDYPDRKYQTIHVAGTNGKGSVCTKIAKACELSGKKTGLYTSPHIKNFSERIQINGVPISDDVCEDMLKEIFELSNQHNLELSFFDTATLLAFTYFARNHVDIAIIETGLGGRWDSTNIIHPILSVITTIGFDHTEILGNSIEEIAYAKAGICKPDTALVIGPQVPKSLVTPYCNWIIQPIGTFKTYDDENRATAEAALIHLGIRLHGTDCRPPCRLERLEIDDKSVFLDAGHNPEALQALFASLKPLSKPDILCAFSKEKDVVSCLKLIAEQANHIYLTKADSPRAMPPEEMGMLLKKMNFNNFSIHQNVKDALVQAAQNKNSLLICGTFYILESALAFFEKKTSQSSIN